MNTGRFRIGLAIRALAGALAAAAVPRLGAQTLTAGLDPKVQAEIEYAEALQALGLPSYAETVLDRIAAPEAKPLMKVIRLKALVSRGDWGKVKGIIAAEPDQDSQDVWAMKLALADGYYAFGTYAEARAIYDGFFKRYADGPPPSLNTFYIESAYKYAQMLMLMQDLKSALVAYERLAKAKLERHVRRQVISETAELMLRVAEQATDRKERDKYFERITKILNEVMWVQDLWFGKAVVMMAHMRMIEGNIDGAMDLVDDYWGQLKEIDNILKQEEKDRGEDLSRLSPMAQCRYLLGIMLLTEAEKLIRQGAEANRDKIVKLLAGADRGAGKQRSSGALQHFLNVLIQYPGTPWAPDAGARARRVEEILRGPPFSAKITTNISDAQMARVQAQAFQNAHAQYNNRQFEEAAGSYVEALNLFPEGESSVAALGELARCYIELESEVYADAVIGHLAERFCRRAEMAGRAGDELIRTAMAYGERNWPERKAAVEKVFFTFFPKHPSAAPMIFRAGEQRMAADDVERALPYFERIRDGYAGQPIWFDAMNRIALCHSKAGKPAEEIKVLAAYSEALQKEKNPGHALISAMYREAAAYRKLGDAHMGAAFNRFVKLTQLLSDPAQRQKYQSGARDEEANLRILEGALYNKAACYVNLPPPEGKPESSRKEQAIQTLEQLVEQFPKSEYAPAALSQIGTLWTILDKPEQAGEALRRLQKDYPDTPEAKNSLFVLGMNLLRMNRKQHATAVFKEMFTSQGKFTPRQILTAGNELFKERQYEIALEAYERALAGAADRTVREPALLGKGRTLIEQKQYAPGAEALESLFKEFPRSGFTIEAALYLSRAYGEMGAQEPDENRRVETFNKSVGAMKRARLFEQTKAGRARLDVEVGRILYLKARAEDQFGTKAQARQYRDDAIATYQAVILLADSTDPGVRPWIETAYSECLPAMIETERWKDVIESCDDYFAAFREGRFERDISSFRNRARVQLAALGQAEPAPAAATNRPAAKEGPAATDMPAATNPPATDAGAGTNTPAGDAAVRQPEAPQ